MLVRSTDILIHGAGLQGTGVALELARRGIRVTLMDAEPRAMNRASLRNEGKIHLGFIYADDRTLGSAFLQIDGALRFRAILAHWIGRRSDWLALSAIGAVSRAEIPIREKLVLYASLVRLVRRYST